LCAMRKPIPRRFVHRSKRERAKGKYYIPK
jgi:hypothetical protein